jgi:hypothetical protein
MRDSVLNLLMKKKIIIGALAVLPITILLLISLLGDSRQEEKTPESPEISPVEAIDQRRRINVSGISVRDFTDRPIRKNPDGDILFIENPSYQATYLKNYNQFLINMSTSSARKIAEGEFIKNLGISKEEACTLDVVVLEPYEPNPYLSVPPKELSFCHFD